MQRRFAPAALLLDMDGLMVDSEPLWFEAERAFVVARGRGDIWTEDLWRACIGKGMRNTLEVMRDAVGVEIDLDRDLDAIPELFVARAGAITFKPGCLELLDLARGRLPIAVASSSPARLVGAVVDQLGIRGRFAALVTGNDVARHKPAPDVFLEAARRLGVAPAGCLVLEDSLPGVTAARAAGAQVIAVPEGDPAGRGFEAVADAIEPDLFAAAARIDWP